MKNNWLFKSMLVMMMTGMSGLSIAALNPGITCNNTPITMDTPENVIEANCIADAVKTEGTSANATPDDKLAKVKFITDDNSQHICSYQNNKLIKCTSIKFSFPQ